MKLKLISFMSFIFIIFIVVFILFFYNNKYQINLFQDGLTKAYYENADKTLKTTIDSMADSLGSLVKGMDEKDQLALISKAINGVNDIRLGGGGGGGEGYYFGQKDPNPLIYQRQPDLGGKNQNYLKAKNGH
ncbi:hypothetical protein BKH43_05635 [Helicobacter sp. 13S00401-1]|uniref:hypothetical protein n=1 Tax=Helicobacter sp. 13S00401-1 TaxID=1905758 RepID=UPI000BA57E40|nr:hypothetical protein [Helicobacter sp. 13S00401-1]PAF50214.1 hypothetical protein BKH43_05635 [Helicobacter sp. 13S00401-1]